MDDLIAYNKARWEALAEAGVDWSRPYLDLTPERARAWLDPYALMGDVAGRDVLCLAAGGGQQSAAFGLLGANVTVLDLSQIQLARDHQAAAHYGHSIETVQGDMRDLSVFADDAFDLVFLGWSLSFVPDIRPVVDEVARVLRPGGLLFTEFANPFVVNIDEEKDWSGEGYLLKWPYVDGEELSFEDPDWTWTDEEGTLRRVEGPREFRHALSTILNTLAGQGFALLRIREAPEPKDPDAAPGTWDHRVIIAPPWLKLWAVLRPDLLATE
ncbi:MAG: class I SAM-dependent methyltransferase [Candidatus Promineifilaceae bacterium]|nr:class I SAM-dependent methyltransferase [Candidatus Promineifilaceae bacterium]